MIRWITALSAVAISVTLTATMAAGPKRRHCPAQPCPQGHNVNKFAEEKASDLTHRMLLMPEIMKDSRNGVGTADVVDDELLEEGFRKITQKLGLRDDVEWSFVFDQLLRGDVDPAAKYILSGTLFRCGDGSTCRETRVIQLGDLKVRFTRVKTRNLEAPHGVVTQITTLDGEVKISESTLFYTGRRQWE